VESSRASRLPAAFRSHLTALLINESVDLGEGGKGLVQGHAESLGSPPCPSGDPPPHSVLTPAVPWLPEDP
jgi:hypothetical protein